MKPLTARTKRGLRVVGLVIVTVALAGLARSIDWTRAAEALRHANGAWLLAAIAANACILVCWAAFWSAIRPPQEKPARFSTMLEIAATSSALMNTLPFGGGHASSIPLLIRRGGLTQRGALSVMALDQLGEGLIKIVVFLVVALTVAIPTWMKAGVTTLSVVVAVWFVTLVVISRWSAELAVVRDWRRASRAVALVAAMKGVQLVGVVAVQLAYDVHVGAAGSLLALASILFASMLPVAPGNLGTYEAGLFFAYRHLGVAPETALSLAIMQHVCFLIPAVGAGYVVLSRRTLSRKAIASR